MKSKDFQNGEFPRVPVPEYKEGAYHYHLRIKPLFDAIVSRAQQFLYQIKVLKKNHQEEIEKLKDDHEVELEKVKADSAAENQTAIEKVFQAKAAEKDVIINALKEEVQKEKTEKEKWYTALFKKFSLKIGDKTVEVNKGLSDAYIEKSSQLAEWENRNGDELITLGTSYKKFRVQKWKEYLLAKSRIRKVDYDMSR